MTTQLIGPRSSTLDFHSVAHDLKTENQGEPTAKLRRTSIPLQKVISNKAYLEMSNVEAHEPAPSIFTLPQDVILLLIDFLDLESALSFLRTCKWFNRMLEMCDSFWKKMSFKTEFAHYVCLKNDPHTRQIGWEGQEMHIDWKKDHLQKFRTSGEWRKTWRRGIQMRRNIVTGNYQSWRLFSNTECPITELTLGWEMDHIEHRLANSHKMSVYDNIKVTWDKKHMVLFHFFRRTWGESCTIRLWDIENEPKFLYQVDKGVDYISYRVSIHNNHVVTVPTWPLRAQAIVMTLDISNRMAEFGKYLFSDAASQAALEDNWGHTHLRVEGCQALVVCRAPTWRVLVISIPTCTLLIQIILDQVPSLYECQQIRFYNSTAVILFKEEKEEMSCDLVTMDIQKKDSRVRSYFSTQNVTGIVLYADPEEIHLMKRNGNLILYDADTKNETVKIKNTNDLSLLTNQDYQVFINGKEQICIMQSNPMAPSGRHINVYTYQGCWLYQINLDLDKYALSRNDSVCIYANPAFLAVADSKRFLLFNIKSGSYIGVIHMHGHLEWNKGKPEDACIYEHAGLVHFVFEENKLIAVHDYERSFPAILDVYKFW